MSENDIHDVPLYIGVDPATTDTFEFITDDEDALVTWLDQSEDRFYYERYVSPGSYVRELVEQNAAENQ